jgi:hypothetical protein
LAGQTPLTEWRRGDDMGFLPWIALGMIVKILTRVIAEKLVAVVVGIVG